MFLPCFCTRKPVTSVRAAKHIQLPPPKKLTWQWKITISNRRYIFKLCFFPMDMRVFEGVVEFLDTPKTGALLKMGVLNKNDIQSQRMTFRIQGYFLTHLLGCEVDHFNSKHFVRNLKWRNPHLFSAVRIRLLCKGETTPRPPLQK